MNVKRNLLATLLASALIGVGTNAAGAVDYSWLIDKGFFGSHVQGKPDATVKISSTTKDVHLDHYVTAKFENDRGQSFVWRFDSAMEMSNFLLKTIAPTGFDAGNARVIIWHPGSHYAE
jgi:hypothetical protein